jgi:hypothetical protein
MSIRDHSHPLQPRKVMMRLRRSHREVLGVVHSSGFHSKPTPQSAVHIAVLCPRNERSLRAAQVGTRYNPLTMYAPPSTNDADFSVRKGMLAFCIIKEGQGVRGSLGNDTTVAVCTNMNGLSRSTTLGMVGILQTTRDATDPTSEDRAALMIRGIGSLHNTGRNGIHIGQKLITDPNPSMVKDAAGELRSGIEIAGVPSTVTFPQVRGLNDNSLHSSERHLRELVRERMSSPKYQFAALATQAWSQPQGASLQFGEVCKQLAATICD